MLHLYLLSVIILLYVLHLDLLEHDGGFVLKKLLISHASLKLFWESLNSMVIFLIIICLVFKICETSFWVCLILRKDWSMIIVLRYGGDNIKVLLVGWLWIWEILVLKLASPVACTYGKRYVTNLKHEVFFDCPPYEWRSGTSDGLLLPIYPPRSMHVVLCFND